MNTSDSGLGRLIEPLQPVELRKRISQVLEGELVPLNFMSERTGFLVRVRANIFADELRISFNNSQRSLGVRVSPNCAVSFPVLTKAVMPLLDKQWITTVAIAQNLGYVSPHRSFATYTFPLDRDPELLAHQLASDYLQFGLPFCESIRSYDDAIDFIEKSKSTDAIEQFKKAALHLMAGRKDVAIQLAKQTVGDLERRAVTDNFYAVPALERARRAMEWFEHS